MPLKPGIIESIYQYIVVTILIFPKLILVSISLVYVPFLFPITMILEWVLILLYNKAIYGDFFGKILVTYIFLKFP